MDPSLVPATSEHRGVAVGNSDVGAVVGTLGGGPSVAEWGVQHRRRIGLRPDRLSDHAWEVAAELDPGGTGVAILTAVDLSQRLDD